MFDDALRPGQPEQFTRRVPQGPRATSPSSVSLRRSCSSRGWKQEIYQLADDFWPRDDGKPERTYEAYAKASLDALARLAESDRGLKYLSS